MLAQDSTPRMFGNFDQNHRRAASEENALGVDALLGTLPPP